MEGYAVALGPPKVAQTRGPQRHTGIACLAATQATGGGVDERSLRTATIAAAGNRPVEIHAALELGRSHPPSKDGLPLARGGNRIGFELTSAQRPGASVMSGAMGG
jgi:hypothetical protein